MAEITWWSKTENDAGIETPEIGGAGTVLGSPAYDACKFNDGMNVDANGEGWTVPLTDHIDFAEGAIGMWIKPSWDAIASHCSFIKSDETVFVYFQLYYDGGTDELRFQVYTAGSGWLKVYATPGWAINDLVHLAVVWKAAGGIDGGSDSLKLYIDGVEIDSLTTTWTPASLGTKVYFGNTPNGSQPAQAIIDNLKMYDYAKVDWSDRNTEGGASDVTVNRLKLYRRTRFPGLIHGIDP